ncbi:hypothetical protein B7463_g3262, partial [Scytalidium lignicola]
MARVLQTRACDARRGIECLYPPAKPSCFILCEGDNNIFPVGDGILSYSSPQWSAYLPDIQARGADDTSLSLGLDIPSISSSFNDNQLAITWFTAPDTWKIRYPQAEHNSFHTIDLKRHIATIHQWLTEWVEKGSNQFIHARLYRTRFPRCIQDAYMSLSCYLHKTASNEQFVFQIIEDRAKQLLAEHGINTVDSLPENTSTRSASLDSLEHIARVQALLIYQALGLYDGDIRLRHLAENHIPVLNSWIQQMVEHSSQAQGRPAGYQGGMMFTTRQGVWEAQSALAWEKLCSEVDVGLTQLAEADKLFTEVAPGDVNDFTKLILEVTFGTERMERWGV